MLVLPRQVLGSIAAGGPVTAPHTPVHPRPQLARERWKDLSGTWRFAVDPDAVGLDAEWPIRTDVYQATIEVPYPPGSPLSGVPDVGSDAVWYQRDFAAAAGRARDRLILHCQAVDYRAMVWVNGQAVATHEGGHTPFACDITACLRPDGDQLLTIRAEDPVADLEQPRGKQGWLEDAHQIWHKRTTGIWQRVWLEWVPPTRIRAVRWTADVDSASIGVDVRLHRGEEPGPLRLQVQLRVRDQVLADDTYEVTGERVRREIALSGRMIGVERRHYLWAPEHPNVIEARLTLLGPKGVVDEVSSYTALRSVGTARNRFLLNGRPYFLRMVLDHGYWPQSRLAAPSREALRDDVQLIKDLGFNGVRVHQKVADPEFLYWCDRLGLLVWAEMPATYEFSDVSIERVSREWIDVLQRDYNHPCIVTWLPLNESWGVPALRRSSRQRAFVQALYQLAKAMDGTRLVIGNDGWESLVSDLLTIHDYADGRRLAERYSTVERTMATLASVEPHYRALVLEGHDLDHRPIVISECGGLSLRAPAEAWKGYGAARSGEELLANYREVITAMLDSPALAGFCYTQFTDTGVEHNGLVTAAREPKVDPAQVRAITRRAAAAVPGDVTAAHEYGDYPDDRDAIPGDGASAGGRPPALRGPTD
jgi:hypothetical protein